MKIGIMARTLDDGDGVGIATTNLIDKLIEIGHEHKYVILYRTDKHFGRYKHRSHATEIMARCRSKFIWDQLLVPYIAWRHKIDVLLCAKYTVPLLTKCPTVVVNHGVEYYTLPHFYEWHDLMYVRTFLPLYYQRATKVVAISNDLQDLLHRYVHVPYERMATVYYAANERFFRRENKNELEQFRQKYGLPDNFVVTATKVWRGKKLSNRKNIDNIVRAFLSVRKEHPALKLVIAGEDCRAYIAAVFGAKTADDPGFVYPGWIPQEEMPYLYSLARALLFPSYSESFGLPLVEAMACGCPVITSTGGACPEIVGDAALVIDPTDVGGLTESLRRVLVDADLRRVLVENGLRRAAAFSWRGSAERMIEIFEEVVHKGKQTIGSERVFQVIGVQKPRGQVATKL
jgi:glycosyltransferase involved in cell wall biosynthesis